MLTFKELVNELAREDVSLSAEEVREMTARFGKKVLQMGHLEDDGRMLVPVDCVVAAAQSLEAKTLTQAAKSLDNEQMASILRSGEVLVERVVEAGERKLRELIRRFEAEPYVVQSDADWKKIEKEVFGVEFLD